MSDYGYEGNIKKGAIRELNPGPPVPKTGIIPLDQSPLVISFLLFSLNVTIVSLPDKVLSSFFVQTKHSI